MTALETIHDGATYLQRGDLASAERVARALLAEREDPDVLHLLALVRVHQNRLEDALPFFRRSLTLRPRHGYVLLNLGRALSLLRRDEEAAALLGDAVSIEPGLVLGWQEWGDVALRLKDENKAAICFRRVLALEPGHLMAKLSLGAILKDNGGPAEAEKLLAEGLAEAQNSHLKAGFAYNLAQAQYVQGKKDDALANFTLVRTLEPSRSSVEISRTDLLEELARYDEAEGGLKALLEREPQNEDAHVAYNDLLYRLKRDSDFLKSYDRAPATPALAVSKAGFLFKMGRYAEAHALYGQVLSQEPGHLGAMIGGASSLNQLGRHDQAMAELERARARHPSSATVLQNMAVTALQLSDGAKAVSLAEQSLRLAPMDYLGLAVLGSAWRMAGDERDEMLNGYDELIGCFDLETPKGFSSMAKFNAALSEALDRMHTFRREPINQSLRGGSQTRGNIFNEGHDLVERLKTRINEAMKTYIAGIKPDERHPFRGRRAKDYRFTGSWSSRLADCGYHINHIHPEGWISSCYYVAVPDAVADTESKQGWIKFGEPSVEVGLGPRRAIQPAPGRLVLFPSYMWHGTIPFHSASNRITIAFDAVPSSFSR